MVVMIKRAVEALLVDGNVKLWPKDFGLDPLLDPFPADVAAKILLIDQSTFFDLVNNHFVVSTCQGSQLDGISSISYWDILEATTFMSLASVWGRVDFALEEASLICDLLAFYYEKNTQNVLIDVFLLADIIGDHLDVRNFDKRFPEVGLTDLSFKIAIDILNVHSRCVNFFASTSLFIESRTPDVNIMKPLF